MAEGKKAAAKSVKTAAKKAPAKAAAKKAEAKSAPEKTVAKVSAEKAAPAKQAAKNPTHAQIAELAHSYWKDRGQHHGQHHDDWLRAESELKK